MSCLLPSFRGARAAVRVATTAMKRPREGDVTDDVELGEIVARPREDADGASESEEGALPVPPPANPAPADAVYGGDARASVELKPEHALGLKLSSVHELITWVMTDRGANPRWAFVRNKPLVSRVVLLLVPGLDRARCASSAELMPNTRAALGVGLPTTFDNPTANELNVARALLCSVSDRAPNAGVARERRGVAAARSSRARDGSNESTSAADLCRREMPFPPAYYALSPETMVDMDYPIPLLRPSAASSSTGEDPSPAFAIPEGFVVTQPSGGGVARSPPLSMAAIDCEMCYTGSGADRRLELTRASVVGPDGSVLYDTLVLPSAPITDYNTAFSGITAEQMRGVTTRLEDVQRELLELVAAETILIGHSLENDLKRLRMIHANCVDTVALYPHKRGPPFRTKLSALTEKHLGRKIQEGTHDSVPDARATMELALLKMVHGPGFGEPDAEGGSLFAAVAAEGRRCHVVDRETALRRLAAVGASSTAAAINDAEAETMLISEVRKPTGGGMLFKTDADAEPAEPAEPAASRGADLVFGHLRGYYEHLEGSNKRWAIHTGARLVAATGGADSGAETTSRLASEEEDAWDDVEESVAADAALMDVDAVVGNVWEAMPPGGMLVVATGVGDSPRLRTLQERKWKRAQGIGPWGEWTDEAEVALRSAADRARTGMVYAGVK